MKLNRLQRVGIVLSVLWIIFGAGYERKSQVDGAISVVNSLYVSCLELENIKDCSKEHSSNLKNFMEPVWSDVALSAFAPVILGWLIVFIIIRVYRWIKAGEV
jgi:hypothetical protein